MFSVLCVCVCVLCCTALLGRMHLSVLVLDNALGSELHTRMRVRGATEVRVRACALSCVRVRVCVCGSTDY